MNEFVWPWQYNFPPFFTLQPNKDVLKIQLDAWCSLVVSWGKHNNIAQIDVTESSSLPVFRNEAISRSLSPESIQAILDELCKRGNLEWNDKLKKRGLLFWRSPTEWGEKLYAWAQNTSHIGSVCTFYELLHGNDTSSEEFHNLDEDIFKKALLILQTKGKAEIMEIGDSQGVKFL